MTIFSSEDIHVEGVVTVIYRHYYAECYSLKLSFALHLHFFALEVTLQLASAQILFASDSGCLGLNLML